jgi:hypothetical protein
VLSGGGAMGIAHVGVIQTLEKMGIPPRLGRGARPWARSSADSMPRG